MNKIRAFTLLTTVWAAAQVIPNGTVGAGEPAAKPPVIAVLDVTEVFKNTVHTTRR